tara:strand:+ start:1077 stop:3455 length:2379 start_codon:yes stop_codon:yes gene_type:complete
LKVEDERPLRGLRIFQQREGSLSTREETFDEERLNYVEKTKEVKKMIENDENSIEDGKRSKKASNQIEDLVKRTRRTEAILNYVETNFGATISHNLRLWQSEGGFQVALKGHEKAIQPSVESFLKYLDEVKVELKEDRFIGLWLEDGVLYADISVFIEDEKEAIAFGEAEEQKGIWSWRESKTLYLDEVEKDSIVDGDFTKGGEKVENNEVENEIETSNEVGLKAVEDETTLVESVGFEEPIEDEESSPKVTFFLSIIEMTSGHPLRLNFVSFNGIEGVMESVESMTFNINHQDSVQTVVIPNSVGLAYSPTELRIAADEVIIGDDGRGVLDGLHIFTFGEDGWEISYEAPCSIEDDSIEDDDDDDGIELIEDEDENWMEVFGETEESLGEWAKDYVFSFFENSESHIEDVKKAVRPEVFDDFFIELGLYETDGGRDLCLFVENQLFDFVDGEFIEDEETIKTNLIRIIKEKFDGSIEAIIEDDDEEPLDKLSSPKVMSVEAYKDYVLSELRNHATFNDTVTQTTEGRSENKGGEDVMKNENVSPKGNGLTEIGTVTGGENDNYIELSSTGGWGWRTENGDLMNSIDSVKIACNLEDYNTWMSLLKANKPLEASEIPSLMEAFPFGETTELKVGRTIEDEGTFEVPNELIHQTILTSSRHSLLFNSYGIAAMTSEELYEMVAEDSGFEPAWRVMLNEDGSINYVDDFCFNDTDGECAYVAGLGFANFFNIEPKDKLVDDAEGIWKRFGPEDIGSPMETLHCPTEGCFVETNSNGYLVLRTKDYFDDSEDEDC